MPKVPRPSDMAAPRLDPAGGAAQLNIGAASAIGASGRAMGNAIASIGQAFGEVAGRIGAAQESNNYFDAKLEWMKGDYAIQSDIAANAGEDGALWQTAPERYKQLNDDIAAKYPITNPEKRRSWDMWRETQTFDRGIAAAKTYQGAQRGQFLKGFEQDLQGFEQRIEKGDIDPATFGELYGVMSKKLSGMNRTILHQADVEAKTKEMQGRLAGAVDAFLSKKAPQERAQFWDSVSKGQYEINQPAGSPVPGNQLQQRTFFKGAVPKGEVKSSANAADDDTFGAPGTNLTSIVAKGGALFTVNQKVAGNFIGFINELESMGYHINPKQSGAFIDRNIAGSERKSQHAYGNALDINWDRNTDRSGGKNDLPENIGQIAAKYGLTWGGNWRRQDTMHFEWHPDHSVPAVGANEAGKFALAQAEAGVQAMATAYSPKRGGDSMEGGYASATPGPDGKAEVRTLADYASGRSKYVTLAGDPSQYGKTYTIPEITFRDASGKEHTLKNVKGVVHDTGSAFKGKGDSRIDIPADKDLPDGGASQPYSQKQVQLVPDGQIPVSQRGLTQFAGLTRGTMTDAVPEAGDDRRAKWASSLTGMAAAKPDQMLSEIYDGEQASELASLLPKGTDLGKVNAADAAKLLGSVKTADASNAQPANDNQVAGTQPTVKGSPMIPEGRLVGGQTFSVKTPKGEFKIPAEWINALPAATKKEYARRAHEEAKIYERQLKSDADDMMANQEAYVAEHGKNAPGYDFRAVEAAYAAEPKKIAVHARRVRAAQEINREFKNAADLPDDELVARIERLAPSESSPNYAESKDIFEKAEKRLHKLMKQREVDPGGSVEGSKDVMAARETLVGGQPRNKLDQIKLMSARLAAQRRLDISEDARNPLTADETRALAAPLRGLNPGDAMARIEEVHKGIKEKYGDKYSGLILRKVIETTVKDKTRRESFGAFLTELDENGAVSPSTMARIREQEEIAAGTRKLPEKPAPKPASPGILERLQSGYRDYLEAMTPKEVSEAWNQNIIGPLTGKPAPGKPLTPPRSAIDNLKQNPRLAPDFERKYNLPAGSVRKYLLQ